MKILILNVGVTIDLFLVWATNPTPTLCLSIDAENLAPSKGPGHNRVLQGFLHTTKILPSALAVLLLE